MPAMDVREIMEYLPHRYPFLLVDRILECDDKKHIVGIKNVSVNEPYFQGHFPGEPVMPGVLILEAMAQTGGLLLMRVGGRAKSTPYFMAIDKAKFRKVVRPGDQLRIEADILKMRKTVMKLGCRVLVDGAVVSQAELMVMVMVTDQKADL